MRVYHFLSDDFALINIKERRLKIATIMELNDPFELLALDLSDPKARKAFNQAKAKISKKFGFICFSRNWHSPLLWGHYANKHKGICLGFDIPDNELKIINYSSKRNKELIEKIRNLDKNRVNYVGKHLLDIVTTKFYQWRYEKEARRVVTLQGKEEEGLYFEDFGEIMKLKQVIVGSNSNITRDKVCEALGSWHGNVEAFKVRTSFKVFRMVRNADKSLWK